MTDKSLKDIRSLFHSRKITYTNTCNNRKGLVWERTCRSPVTAETWVPAMTALASSYSGFYSFIKVSFNIKLLSGFPQREKALHLQTLQSELGSMPLLQTPTVPDQSLWAHVYFSC